MAEKVYRGTTREERGISLYREQGEEIADIGDGFFIVPSAEPGDCYLVNLEHENCECPDHQRRGRPCKHIFAAIVYRAKGRGGEWSPSPAPCRRVA